jgi:LPXTG-motif cell wall-anchored protein
MEKLAGLGRAPRRRWAVAIVTGTVLVIAGTVALAMPAFANHVGDMTADCKEVVVTFVDFPSGPTPVHIAIQVGSVGSTSADVSVSDNTPPKHVNIMSLTNQLHGQSANVVVDVTWHLDTDHHEHGSFPVTCGTHTTSSTGSSSTSAPTSAPPTSVPVTVTTGGGPVTTATSTSVPTSVSVAGESTSTSLMVSPETAALPPGASAVSAGGESLPFTGSSSLPLLLIGIALLIGGAAAVLAPRRRRSES